MVFTRWLIIVFAVLIVIFIIYSFGYTEGYEDALSDVEQVIDAEEGDNDDR